MLEIKNLTKIYKTKGGEDVRALDNVSIRFEEKGLVFLLGKSGSGKSTLLNLAGGLDEPTSGEIVVMGKSSKDFSGSDFDSYRNTYVGFVFQEYNVLNEFNVEDNIALALELQGKTHEKEKVQSILEQVELASLGKRKPNTLSGGQKQRIAIARALVKDPQIIMADEPTGALDSATGRQVFDTLKKLSESRLVLVVSHDREFAEIYGDRIVELKDGKIVSDVVKVKEAAASLSDGLTRIGEDTLAVKAGAVDDTAMQQIRKFLSESKGDVLISRGEREIESFRRANRIDENGARERFAETDENALDIKRYDGDKTRFIRSRLPVGKAIRIGASGLKLKPFRLILTILLSLVSFVMFGLSSTMMLYNPDTVLVKSFLNSDYEYLTLRKYYESRATYAWEDDSSSTIVYPYNAANFTPAEVEALGGKNGFGVYDCGIISSFSNIGRGDNPSPYYNPHFGGFTALPEGHALRDGIVGRYPEEATEICVSSYFFECVKNGTFYPLEKDGTVGHAAKQIRTETDLIGEQIDVGNVILTVVGVFPSGEIPAKYDELKNEKPNSYSSLSWEFQNYLQESMHPIAFATEGISAYFSSPGGEEWVEYFHGCNTYFRGYMDEQDLSDYYSILDCDSVAVYTADEKDRLPVYRFDGSDAPLRDDELIIGFSSLSNYLYREHEAMRRLLKEQIENDPQPKEDDYTDFSEYLTALDAWNNKWNAADEALENEYFELDSAIQILNGYMTDENGNPTEPTERDVENALQTLLDHFEEPFPLLLTGENYDYGVSSVDYLGEFKIVGFYYSQRYPYGYDGGLYCSQNFYDKAGVYQDDTQPVEETKYVPEEDAVFSSIFVPFEKNEFALRRLFSKLNTKNPDNDVMYKLVSDLYSSVEFANELIGNLSIVFLVVGLVFMVFSALLLFNFITMSISNKKKEIGILRAVGARGADVFKIFFAESGIIVGICTVLAIAGSFALTLFLNSYLKAEAGLQVTLFVFGPLSIAIMIGVALLVAFLGTFLPVFFASRKKPVESIRAL